MRFWVCFLSLIVIPSLGNSETAWPQVMPLDRSFQLDNKVGAIDTPVSLLISDVSGAIEYRLECHNGNYEGTENINYSGDLQCALFALKNGKRDSWNLLAPESKEARASDWLNRGRMLSRQLKGECSNYVEYGAVRHFALRNMMITLRYSNLVWSADALKAFDFNVDVQMDPGAANSVAAPTLTPKPPRTCD